jgi:hypothetical protein
MRWPWDVLTHEKHIDRCKVAIEMTERCFQIFLAIVMHDHRSLGRDYDDVVWGARLIRTAPAATSAANSSLRFAGIALNLA